MAILTRLASRIWNLTCTIILSVFFALPLALFACLTTCLAIFFTWILATRMVAAAVSKRIDFWRSVDHHPGLREAQIDEAVRYLATGPSLVQTSRPRSSRTNTMSSGSRMPPSNDRNFEVDYDDDYGYDLPNDNDIANDEDDDDNNNSEALYLGGWRRRNSRTSPTSSRPTTPGTAAYQYRLRSNSTTPSSAPNYYPSVTLPPATPVANVAARRSTTSAESRRSSRVLSSENSVRGEMGEDV
jgi:hypothetical protein